MPRIAPVLLALASSCVACQQAATPATEAPASRNESVRAPAPAEAARAGSASPASGGANGDDITMRYACEHGHAVAIVRGGSARVSLADGRVVEIPRIADSSPPRYSGAALSFDVDSHGATLGQHEVGGSACREAD